MNATSHTVSLCPTCYAEIPARIEVGRNGVRMFKTCPQHGEIVSMVERDPVFYQWVRGMNSPSIYEGYFMDVTRTCNLRCDPCYYHLEKADPVGEYSIPALVSEARVNALRAPFILTGGEPTMREDLPEVIVELSKVGPVELLSNGVRLAKDECFNEIMPLITRADGIANLNLSLHTKETDAWQAVVARCRSERIKIESALIVINSEDEFLSALKLAKELGDTVCNFRIKAASKIWAEQKPDKLFTSDLWNWLEKTGKPVHLIRERHNKTSIVNVAWDGLWLMLVSWYDTSNVDLLDINCAPWYRARSGEVANMVTAMLLNEGFDKGWLKGRNFRQGEGASIHPHKLDYAGATPAPVPNVDANMAKLAVA